MVPLWLRQPQAIEHSAVEWYRVLAIHEAASHLLLSQTRAMIMFMNALMSFQKEQATIH